MLVVNNHGIRNGGSEVVFRSVVVARHGLIQGHMYGRVPGQIMMKAGDALGRSGSPPSRFYSTAHEGEDFAGAFAAAVEEGQGTAVFCLASGVAAGSKDLSSGGFA